MSRLILNESDDNALEIDEKGRVNVGGNWITKNDIIEFLTGAYEYQNDAEKRAMERWKEILNKYDDVDDIDDAFDQHFEDIVKTYWDEIFDEFGPEVEESPWAVWLRDYEASHNNSALKETYEDELLFDDAYLKLLQLNLGKKLALYKWWLETGLTASAFDDMGSEEEQEYLESAVQEIEDKLDKVLADSHLEKTLSNREKLLQMAEEGHPEYFELNYSEPILEQVIMKSAKDKYKWLMEDDFPISEAMILNFPGRDTTSDAPHDNSTKPLANLTDTNKFDTDNFLDGLDNSQLSDAKDLLEKFINLEKILPKTCTGRELFGILNSHRDDFVVFSYDPEYSKNSIYVSIDGGCPENFGMSIWSLELIAHGFVPSDYEKPDERLAKMSPEERLLFSVFMAHSEGDFFRYLMRTADKSFSINDISINFTPQVGGNINLDITIDEAKKWLEKVNAKIQANN